MKKDKLRYIMFQYAIDKCFLTLIVLCFFPGVTCFIGIFYDLLYIIPTGIFGILSIGMIVHLLIVRHKINRNELVTINVNGYKAFIREMKATSRNPATLIKIYIIDENKKKYNYYYLNGSKPIFKGYEKIINQGCNLQLVLFKNTNIISSIIVDGEELEDLYYEVRHSKKMIKPSIYDHLYYKRTKKAIYKYEEYDIQDVKLAFEQSNLYEELYIINNEKKYVKISYNQENHREFYIEKKLFNSFDEMINELEIYNFIFDEKIRVIYALDNAVPTSFITIINEVK